MIFPKRALLVLFSIFAISAHAAEKRLNVLLIISDDLNCSLGTYDHPLAKTPNLDRFAKRGVRFEHAYCQYALCNPSRASMMTGLRPDTTGVVGNGVHFRKNVPDAVTLPQLFKNNGYYSARVGKIYHYGVPGQIGTSGLDDPPSWNEFINPRGIEKDEEDKVINLTPKNTNIGGSLTYYVGKDPEEEQTDGRVASETIKLLKKNKDRPFFIACGFYRPHVPCVATKKYFDLYPANQVTIPKVTEAELSGIPQMAFTTKPLNYGLPEDQLRDMKRAYLASVSYMDRQVGRVLDAVKRLKLEDETIIIFTSDHGWNLGEHGQWQKQLLFEESAHIPMIISVPGAKGNGKTSSRTVELVDLYPTLAELCGLEAPTNLEGESMNRLLDNPRAEWKSPAFTQVNTAERRGRSIRTEQWRYTEWDNGAAGAELYDHKNDPNELHNLAKDSKYAPVLAELRSQLTHKKTAPSMSQPVTRKKKRS